MQTGPAGTRKVICPPPHPPISKGAHPFLGPLTCPASLQGPEGAVRTSSPHSQGDIPHQVDTPVECFFIYSFH